MKILTCSHCGSQFDDGHTDYQKFIDSKQCPQCGQADTSSLQNTAAGSLFSGMKISFLMTVVALFISYVGGTTRLLENIISDPFATVAGTWILFAICNIVLIVKKWKNCRRSAIGMLLWLTLVAVIIIGGFIMMLLAVGNVARG